MAPIAQVARTIRPARAARRRPRRRRSQPRVTDPSIGGSCRRSRRMANSLDLIPDRHPRGEQRDGRANLADRAKVSARSRSARPALSTVLFAVILGVMVVVVAVLQSSESPEGLATAVGASSRIRRHVRPERGVGRPARDATTTTRTDDASDDDKDRGRRGSGATSGSPPSTAIVRRPSRPPTVGAGRSRLRPRPRSRRVDSRSASPTWRSMTGSPWPSAGTTTAPTR